MVEKLVGMTCSRLRDMLSSAASSVDRRFARETMGRTERALRKTEGVATLRLLPATKTSGASSALASSPSIILEDLKPPTVDFISASISRLERNGHLIR